MHYLFDKKSRYTGIGWHVMSNTCHELYDTSDTTSNGWLMVEHVIGAMISSRTSVKRRIGEQRQYDTTAGPAQGLSRSHWWGLHHFELSEITRSRHRTLRIAVPCTSYQKLPDLGR
jgi:hypothetical protein